MTGEQLDILAAEIRDFLIAKVSRTGGHVGPNLGVVELTLAMHRVFDSPRDRLLYDTGHQSYVHKILTGRQDGFDRLRQRGGLSGYPSQAESEHDLIENSHASTALSYADGLAKAYALRGEQRSVVAVVGDGALTGGMCWEALNNIATSGNRLVIVVNDNGRSYSPTIGGLADHLSSLRLNPGYEKVLDTVKDALGNTPFVGKPMYEVLHAVKKGIKDAVAPQAMFEDLGIKYVGPVDGHDITAVEGALRAAKNFGGPVIVHAVTRKGYGYRPAEEDEADCLHGPGAFDAETGKLLAAPSVKWTQVFADELVAIADERPDVVGITAAMAEPTGIATLARKHPDRVYDVGIAEQHAATSAAGLAMGGLHPVVAVYATFLNRAFDQVLLDVAMHKLPVTFVLDRAGVTGPDGPSHYGIWDMSVFGVVPGLRIAAPATPPASVRSCVRRSPSTTVPPSSGSPPAPSPPTCRRSAGSARSTCWPSRRVPTCCWWRWAPSACSAWRWRPVSPSRATASPWSTRAGCARSRPSWSSWPPATASWSASRTVSGSAVSVTRWARRCGTPTSGCRCVTWAYRPTGTRTAPARRSSPTCG